MAVDIATAIRDKHHAMIEAGVGIGKSLAYLLPGILSMKCSGGVIIIATSSIALSEQIMEDIKQAKDIIRKLYYEEDFELRAVLAKGANNYVCPKKVYEGNVKNVPTWILNEAITCGEKKDFSRNIDRYWKYINGDICSEHKRNCSYRESCAYNRMREQIKDSNSVDVIVINQDMFIQNFILERKRDWGFITSNRNLIIIDEAHNLEEKTRSALAKRWTLMKIQKTLDSISSQIDRLGDMELIKHLGESKDIANGYFNYLFKGVNHSISGKREIKEASRFPIPKGKNSSINSNLLKWSEEYLDKLHIASTMQVSRSASYNDRENNFGELIELIKGLATRDDEDSNNLYWVECEPEKPETYALCYAPKRINEELYRALFRQDQTPVILTSATLCQNEKPDGEKYSYQVQTTGFDGKTYTSQPSPYPYSKNAMLYIPTDIIGPNENHEKYLQQIADRIIELSYITNGRTLVLFTAKDDLDIVYKILEKRHLPWQLLRQSQGGSQSKIKAEFVRTKGILLATGLWEGFNIKGPDLSSVIITKLPFPVPDPIIEYKTSLVTDHYEVLVPEMLIKLRQGAGRLIRDDNDTGILSILDSRINSHSTAPYVKDVLESLPIKNVTSTLTELKLFSDNVVPKVKTSFDKRIV